MTMDSRHPAFGMRLWARPLLRKPAAECRKPSVPGVSAVSA